MNRIRKIDGHSKVTTVVGGDGRYNTIATTTAAATTTTLTHCLIVTLLHNNNNNNNSLQYPYGIAVDSNGNLYMADTFDHAIKTMEQEREKDDGKLRTVAGVGWGFKDGVTARYVSELS